MPLGYPLTLAELEMLVPIGCRPEPMLVRTLSLPCIETLPPYVVWPLVPRTGAALNCDVNSFTSAHCLASEARANGLPLPRLRLWPLSAAFLLRVQTERAYAIHAGQLS
jgi:hypothetical protein